MSKYFTDVKMREILISDYDGKERDILLYVLGDQYLPESIIKSLAGFYHSFGGRYSVRSDAETIKGVTDIYRKFPRLSSTAIDQIGFVYIRDLFERYELPTVLTGLFTYFGETDDAFEIFMEVVSKKADELQREYEEKAKVLDTYTGYSERYIEYLKSLIIREHLSVDKVLESIPSQELIKKDEDQLLSLAKRTRIYLGLGLPISYTLTRMHAKDEDIKSLPELAYHISTTGEIVPATFTKEEYLKQVKQKTKEKE